MAENDKVNILLVDDQPAKLLSYEAILNDLGENLVKASSGREALEHLLKSNIAVVLVDVCMPDLDGFQLAAMIREHPRFQKTAMIFVSAIHLSDLDRLRGYEMGAVDYVPVPVVPEVLRAKVKVFAELYRKTQQLERLNAELEERVLLRTADLEASTARLQQSEQRRSLALAAGNMGSWDWDCITGRCAWDDGQSRIFGINRKTFAPTVDNVRNLIHPQDWEPLQLVLQRLMKDQQSCQYEFRVRRPNGEERWCLGTAAPSVDASGRLVCISGVTVDITDRRDAEERQALLAREIDHRAKNALALVQSIVRLTRANDMATYVASVDGRINALSRVHTVLSQSRWQAVDLRGLIEEEIAPYRIQDADKIVVNGPKILLEPAPAQTLALALHELVTNAVKYGALSAIAGRVTLNWELKDGQLEFHWTEVGGPAAKAPMSPGFGTRIITASIERQLGGKVSFNWPPQGLRCLISIPRNDRITQFPRVGRGKQDSNKDVARVESAIAIAGNRVMVVEDETLIALVISEYLTELGLSIVGPYNTVVEAMAALKNSNVDAAVLDINLGKELAYPLADALQAANVPFIFVTGYGEAGLEERFKDIPVLQKPIDRQTLRSVFAKSKSASNGASVQNPLEVNSLQATAK
jgi:two-component sensor histidine kinase/DNA-binding response OmpR family regulator